MNQIGRQQSLGQILTRFFTAPIPIERLALLRILAPLAILGFMSSRVIHADTWIGNGGFSVPDLGGDWRQPFYLSPLPVELSWLVALTLVVSGVATVLGFQTAWAAGIFALTLGYVALADRLAAFTVSKLSPTVVLVLCFSPSGARYSLDSYLARRKGSTDAPTHVTAAPIRFCQLLLPVFYCASGIAKIEGEWLDRFDVLWTHLHDSYQTPVSYLLAKCLPGGAWPVFQITTLLFEAGAPIWFAWKRARLLAMAYGIGMHILIGLMFGPVIWFALLMIALLLASYLPETWVQWLFGEGRRLFGRTMGG